MKKFFAIIAIFIFIPSIAAAGMLLGSGVESGSVCALNSNYDTSGESFPTSDSNPYRYQRLKITSSQTVCEVTAYIIVTSGSHTIHIGFYTPGDVAIGNPSSSQVVSSTGEYVFTWALDEPTLTSDCRMYYIPETQSDQWKIALTSDANGYEDTNYDYVSNGGDRNKDSYFKIKTIQ